ncbi:hypothetical protein B0H10DRAFT_2209306 [Mycena sp. CBHHK59/15]|nr:hypothetical protein B0H10DRAFT_2209306 [Mycena sp. CBHHK59/15]
MARLSLLWPLLFALCVAELLFKFSPVVYLGVPEQLFFELFLQLGRITLLVGECDLDLDLCSFQLLLIYYIIKLVHVGNHNRHILVQFFFIVLFPVSPAPLEARLSEPYFFPSSSTVALASKTAALVVTPSATVKPTSTLDVPPDIVTTAPSSSASASTHVDAASTGFWQNKGAGKPSRAHSFSTRDSYFLTVAGTFVVVALFIIGILGAVGIVLRRRAASRNVARDTFFDTKGPIEHERAHSPGPSMASLGNQPLDAHTTPGPNYGAADHYLVDTTDYNVSYPPGAAYAPAADYGQAPADTYGHAVTADYGHADYTHAAEQHYPAAQYDTQDAEPYDANAYESYTQYYSDPAPASGTGYSVAPANQRPSLSPHPYSHPSHAPSAMRDLVGRDSAYQQSIDSFYGVGAAGGTAV